MANKILIIHGYSDGAQSFTVIRDFFVKQGLYSEENVSYVSYASLEDTACFQDFSYKLDGKYTRLYGQQPIDAPCPSTGSLDVSAWLQMRLRRQVADGQAIARPVEHLMGL